MLLCTKFYIWSAWTMTFTGFIGNNTDKQRARFYNLSSVCHERKKLVLLIAKCCIRLSFVIALSSFLIQEIVIAWFRIVSKKVRNLFILKMERSCDDRESGSRSSHRRSSIKKAVLKGTLMQIWKSIKIFVFT